MMLGLLAAASCDAESTVNRPAEAVAEKQELIRVTVYQLVVDPSSRQPVVALSDAEEKRALFIWIIRQSDATGIRLGGQARR